MKAKIRLLVTPRGPEPAATKHTRPGHEPTLHRSDVLPQGWAQAWVWRCSCGLPSESILRDQAAAYTDHLTEHLVFEVDQGRGRLSGRADA